jgi:DNA-binding SARP family transcriptional activator/tetratricopeptide (TPR) repeat protein
MEFRVLGPLEVRAGGQVIDVGGPRQRRILAALLLYPNRAVSLSYLTEVAWDDDPPATARRQVQNRLATLRRLLNPAGGSIAVRDGGCLVRVEPGGLDSIAFAELAERGRAAADPKLLREALRLWRGPALSGLDGTVLEREVTGLEERRLTVLEECLELELAEGGHNRIVAELRTLVAEHPLRERFVGLLMVALYRCGRQAEALAAYADAAGRLADDLGIDPGPELRRLHRAVLREEPCLAPPAPPAPPVKSAAGSVAPSQLPADVSGFTGRTSELVWLDHVLSDGQTERAPVVSVISGTAGVGKTALAVHWAHRVRDGLGDGQLYLNLRGHARGGPVRPIDALTSLLRGLDMAPERIPPALDDAAALYRSLLADRRVLVLLDDAANAEQVRPLLPGGAANVVLITSRGNCAGLVARDGARRIRLRTFERDEAYDLLTRALGAERVAAEPAATAELASLCAYLPLALRIAAANITDGATIAGYAEQLTGGNRLAALAVEGDDEAAVRSVFDLSYQVLTEPVRRMFRLLGLVPGPGVTADEAASLAAVGPAEARQLLDRLMAGHLTDHRADDRYAYHDLLRLYAVELAHVAETPSQRRAALARLLDHYLHTAATGAILLFPQRDAIALRPPRRGAVVTDLTDRAHALDWFSANRAGLVAAVRLAADLGMDRHAWQLAWNLSDFLYRQGHWHDLVTIQQIAITAARRIDDRAGLARSNRGLANGYVRLGRFADAEKHLIDALKLFAEVGDKTSQARGHLDYAALVDRKGQHDRAVQQAERALDLSRASGYRAGQARALNAIGLSRGRLGDYRASIGPCEQALALQRDLGDHYGEAETSGSLAVAFYQLGDLRRAAQYYAAAANLYRESGSRGGEAVSFAGLGDVHHAAGRLDLARDAWRLALPVLEQLAHPLAGDVRQKLELPPASAA